MKRQFACKGGEGKTSAIFEKIVGGFLDVCPLYFVCSALQNETDDYGLPQLNAQPSVPPGARFGG